MTAAAVQATPVFLDREATVEKSVSLIEGGGRGWGARLMVFPETFIPTYPDWVWRVAGWDGPFEALTARLLEQSVDGARAGDRRRSATAAKAAKAYVSIGVNELATAARSTTRQLYFAPDGSLLGKHRKLMPTGGERLVWGMGDGSTLEVYDTPFGRLGGLICWENYMPLARDAMYAKGVDIWVGADVGQRRRTGWRRCATSPRRGGCYVIGVTPCSAAPTSPTTCPGASCGAARRTGATTAARRSSTRTARCWPDRCVGEEGILYADDRRRAGARRSGQVRPGRPLRPPRRLHAHGERGTQAHRHRLSERLR